MRIELIGRGVIVIKRTLDAIKETGMENMFATIDIDLKFAEELAQSSRTETYTDNLKDIVDTHGSSRGTLSLRDRLEKSISNSMSEAKL